LPGDASWAFPMREVPMAGTCDRERSRGGVSSWDEAPGWEVLFWHGAPDVPLSGPSVCPFEKISCLVTLRTDVPCGPVLGRLTLPFALNGYEADV
jgi:hypothetical protein